jgi:hypothetical protein
MQQFGLFDLSIMLTGSYNKSPVAKSLQLSDNRSPAQKHAKTRPTSNTKNMARIDKSAQVIEAVNVIKRGEFSDYTKAVGPCLSW